MKKIIIYLMSLMTAALFVSCGSGGGGGGASSGTSPVTIAIGDVSAAGSGVVSG